MVRSAPAPRATARRLGTLAGGLLAAALWLAVGTEGVTAAEEPVSGTPTERWSGDTRYTTAVTISQHTHPTSDANRVLLATGDTFPDALAASTTDHPLLLTPTCGPLPDDVAAELARLQPTELIALGGPQAICDTTLDHAADAADAPVQRWAGDTRYTTAVTINQHTHPTSDADRVLLATGDTFPDALAASTTDHPLLLTPTCGPLPDDVAAELARLQPTELIALGGPQAICDTTLDHAADAADAPVQRWAGDTRYTTAVTISQHTHPTSDSDRVLLATGDTFPDALAASTTDHPLLLTPTCGPLPDDVAAELARLQPTELIALGGPQAICDTTLDHARLASDGPAPEDGAEQERSGEDRETAAVFEWAGHEWETSDRHGGPGPTTFDPDHVTVTPEGDLRLRLDGVDGAWHGAEVATTEPVGGYGTYRWTIAVDDVAEWGLIPVLGLFTYDWRAPEEGHREIDIELARWGSESVGNLWYTVWADDSGEPDNNDPGVELGGDRTVQEFTWTPGRIHWETRHAATGEVLGAWSIDDPARVPAPGEERTMMNLWLMNGDPPDRGEVEVRIEDFAFTPP
ncbi:hypothetical protein ER308_12545 [Egibacter rhizosphaerae]|uniref:GH16 domain-containing protein n=1 Tax=Egibacter rhizosphaerae TaxID=1670831 RepID=A0A411YGP2_9ACTN|nr:cell wall-binding repeat-containing protein [Egibacter rhizosphaerae]QBI20311.1 hypothetical protein ER308_12545 [Egibacter rhizosphaerae]